MLYGEIEILYITGRILSCIESLKITTLFDGVFFVDSEQGKNQNSGNYLCNEI